MGCCDYVLATKNIPLHGLFPPVYTLVYVRKLLVHNSMLCIMSNEYVGTIEIHRSFADLTFSCTTCMKIISAKTNNRNESEKIIETIFAGYRNVLSFTHFNLMITFYKYTSYLIPGCMLYLSLIHI